MVLATKILIGIGALIVVPSAALAGYNGAIVPLRNNNRLRKHIAQLLKEANEGKKFQEGYRYGVDVRCGLSTGFAEVYSGSDVNDVIKAVKKDGFDWDGIGSEITVTLREYAPGVEPRSDAFGIREALSKSLAGMFDTARLVNRSKAALEKIKDNNAKTDAIIARAVGTSDAEVEDIKDGKIVQKGQVIDITAEEVQG